MKQKIKDLIYKAALNAHKNGDLPSSEFPDVEVEVPRIESHGDFSTNIAMVMASIQKMPPKRNLMSPRKSQKRFLKRNSHNLWS